LPEKIRANHENLGEIVAHFTSVLQDSFQQVQPLFEELDKYRARFRTAQEQFEQDIRTSRETTLSTFDTIMTSLQNAFQILQSFTGIAIQAREMHSQVLNEVSSLVLMIEVMMLTIITDAR
jgi:predicted PurR-regulated permease PerM